MSKIDTLRNMSAEASQAVLQEVDDSTLLQARIAILNKQEEIKLKSTQQVITLLKELPKRQGVPRRELPVFFGCDMSLFRLPCSKFPLTFLAVPAARIAG